LIYLLLACATPRPAPPLAPEFLNGGAVVEHAPRAHYLRAVLHWERGECDLAAQELELARIFEPRDQWLAEQERRLVSCDANGADE
jgi:hypothetical protein